MACVLAADGDAAAWCQRLISRHFFIGIALGVAGSGDSAMNGFERELNNRILAVVSHGEIEAVDQPWTNWQEALDNVQKVPGIAAAAPYIDSPDW